MKKKRTSGPTKRYSERVADELARIRLCKQANKLIRQIPVYGRAANAGR